MSVTVLDETGTALEPCTERRARILLDRNRAGVVTRNPFTIRLLGDGSMRTEETSVAQIEDSDFISSLKEIGEPIPSWNFDLFVGDKPLWLVLKVEVNDGRIRVRQFLDNSNGIYDLCNKMVRVVYYTDAPSVLMEVSFSLGTMSDVNLSCDATNTEGCAEVAAIYECKFVSMTNHR